MTRTSLSRRILLAMAAMAAMTALLGPAAHAQDIRERNLRFAFSLAKDHPLGLGAQKFADAVAQKSGGRMKVTLYPN
ncbi:MAG: TRAP transporter substrate-binding protein, partial [Oxalobacteraceae bacterium]